MNTRNDKVLKALQLLIDLGFLNLAFFLAVSMRFDDLKIENEQYYNYYLQLLVIVNVSWALAAVLLNNYDLRPGTEIRTSIGRALNAFVVQLGLLALVIVSMQGSYYSRLFLIYFYAFWVPTLLIGRAIFISIWRRALSRGVGGRSIAVLGSGRAFDAFIHELEAHPEYGYTIVGKFSESDTKGLEALVSNRAIDELFCALPPEHADLPYWFRKADNAVIRFRYLPDLGLAQLRNASFQLFGDVPVLYPRTEPLEKLHNKVMKRVFDLVLSIGVIVFVLSWLTPLLAIAIKLSSRGPVFFKQRRSGINDVEFWCWKFRSMVVNDEADRVQASKEDARITAVGRFIRKHNLDELPQFFQVLTGEMSVVGPRPHMLAHTEEYRQLINQFMVRHLIKPGITGLAQVRGFRGETKDHEDMDARVKNDIYYIEHWSVLLDFKIAFQTAFKMIIGRSGGV